MKILPLIGILLVILLVAGCSSSPTGRSVAVPVEQKYCDKQVPHTATERICEQVSYTCQDDCNSIEEVVFSYTIPWEPWRDAVNGGRLMVSVYNGDTIGGNFKVRFINIINGQTVTETIEQYVKAKETLGFASNRVRYTSSDPIDSSAYEVIPPTKRIQGTESGSIYSYSIIREPWRNAEGKLTVSIYNGDTLGGIFKVKFKNSVDGQIVTETVEKYIKAGETIGFRSIRLSYTSTDPIDERAYEVIPPTKGRGSCSSICYRQECRDIERVEYTIQRVPC